MSSHAWSTLSLPTVGYARPFYGVWKLRDQQFVHRATLMNWSILVEAECTLDIVGRFVRQRRKLAATFGMHVSDYDPVVIERGGNGD